MVIEPNWPGDGFAVHCDKCSADDESNLLTFVNAWAELKGKGWRAVHVDGEWEHRCPACAQRWTVPVRSAL